MDDPPDWDGDMAATCPARMPPDHRRPEQPIRPEQLSRFAPIALAGGKVVECPRGLPDGLEAWCLDGDEHWRPASEAPPEPPNRKTRKGPPPMARMIDLDDMEPIAS